MGCHYAVYVKDIKRGILYKYSRYTLLDSSSSLDDLSLSSMAISTRAVCAVRFILSFEFILERSETSNLINALFTIFR